MSVLRFLFPFLKAQKTALVFMSLFCVFWSMKEALFPFFAKQMINVLSKNAPGDLSGFTLPAVSLVTLWILMESAMRVTSHLQKKIFPRMRGEIRKKILQLVAEKPAIFFESELAGNIGSRLTTLPLSCERVVEIFSLHFVSIGCAYGIGLLLFLSVHWTFFVCSVGWFAGYFAVLYFSNEQVHMTQEKHARSVANLNGKIMDVISNMMSVRLFSRLEPELIDLESTQNSEIKDAKIAFSRLEKMKIWHAVLSILFLSSMMSLLAVGWHKEFVSLGDFMLVPMLTFSMLSMVWWLGGEVTSLVKEIGSIESTLKYLDSSSKQKGSANHFFIRHGEIAFKGISFGYSEDQNHFNNFSLKIRSKEMVGIVGATGAGKTTLIKLLLGLYPLKGGAITIDGIDISMISQSSLCEQIAVIEQDPILFHRSIAENIAYGRPEMDQESLIHASKLAHCHAFIERLPQRYQTLVGERGIKLSSGQKQRVAIARAFAKDAPILIIDEATSSLDALIEYEIHKSINQLRQNKTTLIIAHRLSTLRQVDRIVVLDQGRIIEEGTFDFLISLNGLFTKMIAKLEV